MAFSLNSSLISYVYVNNTRIRQLVANSVAVWYEAGDTQNAAVSFEKSYIISAQTASSNSVFFSPDGLIMFVLRRGTNCYVYRYNLSSAWDIATASYHSSTGLLSDASYFEDFHFSPDGTKMYISSVQGTIKIYQYNLGAAWSISGVTAATTSYTVSHTSNGITISQDGTKLYIANDDLNTIYQYTLSVAFDITTSSYSGKSFTTTTDDGDGGSGFPQCINISADGKKMYLSPGFSNKLYQWDLSTPYDISTSTFWSVNNSLSSLTSYGHYVSPDGKHLYYCSDSYDTIRQYKVGI